MAAPKPAARKSLALLPALLLWLVMLPSGARAQEHLPAQDPSWPPPPAPERIRYLATFSRPGIAWAAGRLYLADTTGHRVLVYQRQGRQARLLFQFGRRGGEQGAFNFPVDITVSRSGRVYPNDSMNFRIQVFDSQGRYLCAVGSAGDSTGHFQRTKGVAVDGEENLYVVDALSDTVQIFDHRGRFLLNFGSPGQDRGQFWLPTGLAVDEANRIYVADSYNRRLQMFQYLEESFRRDP